MIHKSRDPGTCNYTALDEKLKIALFLAPIMAYLITLTDHDQ